MSKLRPYQTKMVDEGRARMAEGNRSVLFVAPTGSGKTVLISDVLQKAAGKGNSSIFCVHRRELIHQSVAKLQESGIRPGIIAAGYDPSPGAMVQVASIQTLVRRLHKVDAPRMIVFDECHHVAAASWSKVADHYSGAYRLGLTATPERLDGKGLLGHFGTMVLGPSTAELIEQGYLAPYRAIVPPGVDTSGVRKRAGDYRREDLEAILGQPSVTGDAVREYLERTKGKRAIAFCVSVALSKDLAQAFNDAGVPAEHVDGDTPRDKRDAAMGRFRRGETLVLSNVDLFGEGIDVPAAEVGIFLRPTCSLSLYLQQIGRVLRPNPGKDEAVLLDHAGNILRHGLPDDERQWSLHGRKDREKKTDKATPVRVCPRCYAAVKVGPKVCPVCETEFPVQPRQILKRDGRLQEIDPDEIRRLRKEKRMEQGRAQTKDQLIAIARERGYRNPHGWAYMIMKARNQKRMQG